MPRAKDDITEAIAQAEESFAGALDNEANKGDVALPDAPAKDATFSLTDRDVLDEIEKVNRLWEESNPPGIETGDDGLMPPFDPQEVLADIERMESDAKFCHAYEAAKPGRRWADVPLEDRQNAVVLAKAHRHPMSAFNQLIANL